MSGPATPQCVGSAGLRCPISPEPLGAHHPLAARAAASAERVRAVCKRLEACHCLTRHPITVFSAGSLARGEAGNKSDLDMFLCTEDEDVATSRLIACEVIAELIRVNEAEGFPSFSNDGQYLQIYLLRDLEQETGSADDDGENYFTARMLMLLEAQPLLDEVSFRKQQAPCH